MATQALVSDWITKTRQMVSRTLALYGEFAPLQKEAELTGRVIITPEGAVKSSLTPEVFVGENEGIDVPTFVGAFAAIAQMIASIDDKDAALLFEVKA